MAEKTFLGSIELTKFKSVILEKKQSDGRIIRGVFIPIDANCLEEPPVSKEDPAPSGRVFCPIRLVVRDEQDKYGQNGFISKGVPNEVYKQLKDDKDKLKELQPILGNIKDFATNSSQSDPAPVVKEDDDLPF
jgi:hypothetical protein